MKRILCSILIISILAAMWYTRPLSVNGEEASGRTLELSSPSVLLMESSTGTVVYEQDADQKRSPASITKIMTLILIFDALERGQMQLEDSVTTSAYAKSMGGSQVYLEEGESQTVETMIKCIVIASGNDASVAMAEHISGSEMAFVDEMNVRAAGLGMKNTHFDDCSGLSDSDQHYTSARDVALMSRELITRYPQIYEYSTIWMENITHVTRKGSSEFGLSNTNKLLRSYTGAKGLKTGSTSKAKYCLSATAVRDDMELIAVIMAAPDHAIRFQDASRLLDYGFAACSLYVDTNRVPLPEIPVRRGMRDKVSCVYADEFRYLDQEGNDVSTIRKQVKLVEEAVAPVKKDAVAGKVTYYLGDQEVGSVDILYAEKVEIVDFRYCISRLWKMLCSI